MGSTFLPQDVGGQTPFPDRPSSPDGYTSCPPTVFEAAADLLFLSDGRGGFRDVTQEAGVTAVDGKGLGVAVTDVDQDGRPDIYVANDGMPNFLYRNQGVSSRINLAESDKEPTAPAVPKFENLAAEYGVAVNALGRAEASMGIACSDYDRDGWHDLFVTHFFAETNTLYKNRSGESFTDATRGSGLGAPSRQFLGFGTQFIDFDNDGWEDLFVANGHIDDMRWRRGRIPYRMPPQMFRNEVEMGGEFRDVSQWSGSYFRQQWLGRGSARCDFDEDGDLDLAVSHQRDRSAVLRNDSEGRGPSVIVKLIGRDKSNRSAFHARVSAVGPGRPQVREVIGGGSYQSASDRRIHIGLGPREAIPRLHVRWPSGTTDEWEQVAAGSYIALEGGDLIPVQR